jgi:hypothetical protein
MNAPDRPVTQRAPASSLSRRIIAMTIAGGLVFLILWLMALSALMSLVIATGVCIALLSASTVSDPVETVLEFLVAIVFGVLAAIAAFFAAIFSVFSS